MLVLSRKKNETIKITDEIEVVVMEIKGNRVKLGVEAPKKISVNRGEIWAEIQKEQTKGDKI